MTIAGVDVGIRSISKAQKISAISSGVSAAGTPLTIDLNRRVRSTVLRLKNKTQTTLTNLINALDGNDGKSITVVTDSEIGRAHV